MILNLTLKPASQDQIKAGVVDLQGETLEELKALSTFEVLPSGEEIQERAKRIAALAAREWLSMGTNPGVVMIDGEIPWLVAPLVHYLRRYGLKPVFSFSTSEEVEEVSEDRTISVFSVSKHQGFVDAVII